MNMSCPIPKREGTLESNPVLELSIGDDGSVTFEGIENVRLTCTDHEHDAEEHFPEVFANLQTWVAGLETMLANFQAVEILIDGYEKGAQ